MNGGRIAGKDEYRDVQKDFLKKYGEAKREIAKRVVGLDNLIRLFFGVVLGRGHMAVQASPGMGKTTAITTIAGVFNVEFVRVQFVPTMLPEKLGLVTVPLTEGKSGWTVKEGPLFRADIFFGNEFNRAPEIIQSGLLSALEEYEFEYLGEMRKLKPFFVSVIDYNTLESAGTYGFSEAAFDRFMATLDIREYDRETLRQIIAMSERKKMEPEAVEVKKIFEAAEMLDAARLIYRYFSPSDAPTSWIVRYLTDVLMDVRSNDYVLRNPRNNQPVGPSPRAAEDAKTLSRVFAFLDGEDMIYPEHVKEAVPYSFLGKFFVKPKATKRGILEEAVVTRALERTAIPGR